MLKRSENEIAVIAQFNAKDGKADALAEALHKAWTKTAKEPGCARFFIYQHAENPQSFSVVEKFADQSAFDVHLKMDYLQDLLNKVVPELVENYTVTMCKEILLDQ
jgi:quinol monooxygenase YgiN